MRDPSLELEKPAPFPKLVLLLPRGLPLTALGVILSANTPFKFNPSCLVEEEFINLAKDNWVHYEPFLDTSSCDKFLSQLRIINEKVVVWSRKGFKNKDSQFLELEKELEDLVANTDVSHFSEEYLKSAKQLEC